MTFNFLNPDCKKNLHLVNRVWVEEKDPDFKVENKENVKQLQEDVKSAKAELEEFEKPRKSFKTDLLIETPFKIERFT